MKSLVLTPYCPWPPDTGTKVEMMKHLNVLRELGTCCIASARGKPIGFGWTDQAVQELESQGFRIRFREDSHGITFLQIFGIIYAAVCKRLGFERAFGHSNPYHRYAFQPSWLYGLSRKYDLCVMQYGFWARMPTACPKAVVVHELLSNYHWEGAENETREFANADILIVVGHDELLELKRRGLTSVLWSPPAIKEEDLPLTGQIGLIGSRAPQNIEGLRWLEQAGSARDLEIQVFGRLAEEVKSSLCRPVGRYSLQTEPYEKCGIHLMTRPDRPGLQIKAVEALAYGRAIIARRGSMRGLPEGDDAWINVDSPGEMLEVARELQHNQDKRKALARRAKNFFREYLTCDNVIGTLKDTYRRLVKTV